MYTFYLTDGIYLPNRKNPAVIMLIRQHTNIKTKIKECAYTILEKAKDVELVVRSLYEIALPKLGQNKETHMCLEMDENRTQTLTKNTDKAL